MLLSIGVDPGGKNSAIAIIDSNLNILKLIKAPCYVTLNKNKKNRPKLNKETGRYEQDYKKTHWTDFRKMREIYEEFLKNEIIYTVEKVSSRPGEGEKSSFVFGDSLGIHRGQVSLLNPVEFYEPTPATWKNQLGVTSDKRTSIELANEIFKVSLKELGITLKYRKSDNKDDDLAEALLLAFVGLINYIKE
jgi:hypothetical protein